MACLRSRLRVLAVMTLSTAAVITQALPAHAALYREAAYKTGPFGRDTVNVRVIWDATTVDGDFKYYFGPDSIGPIEAEIGVQMDGVYQSINFCDVTRQMPVCQLSRIVPNYNGTQGYVTRISLDPYVNQYVSPTVYV